MCRNLFSDVAKGRRVSLTEEISTFKTDIDFTDEPLFQCDVSVVKITFVDYGDM